jgi:hypothetical protein
MVFIIQNKTKILISELINQTFFYIYIYIYLMLIILKIALVAHMVLVSFVFTGLSHNYHRRNPHLCYSCDSNHQLSGVLFSLWPGMIIKAAAVVLSSKTIQI